LDSDHTAASNGFSSLDYDGCAFDNPPDLWKAIVDSLYLGDPARVVHEEFLGMFGGDYDVDYANGKGVLLRYVGQAYNPSLPNDALKNFITTNARFAWCSRDTGTNEFKFNWNPGYPEKEPNVTDPQEQSGIYKLVLQRNGQDALNAAMFVAPNESIAC
jgi:hypothetical protein